MPSGFMFPHSYSKIFVEIEFLVKVFKNIWKLAWLKKLFCFFFLTQNIVELFLFENGFNSTQFAFDSNHLKFESEHLFARFHSGVNIARDGITWRVGALNGDYFSFCCCVWGRSCLKT